MKNLTTQSLKQIANHIIRLENANCDLSRNCGKLTLEQKWKKESLNQKKIDLYRQEAFRRMELCNYIENASEYEGIPNDPSPGILDMFDEVSADKLWAFSDVEWC